MCIILSQLRQNMHLAHLPQIGSFVFVSQWNPSLPCLSELSAFCTTSQVENVQSVANIVNWGICCMLHYVMSGRLGEPTSRQCPVRVCEYYWVLPGPFSKYFLFGDKPMTSMGGVFMQKVFITFISSWFIVVIRDLPKAFWSRINTRQKSMKCTFSSIQMNSPWIHLCAFM